MKQITNKRFAIALIAAALILLCSCSCSTRLHTGWYKTSVLKKRGYKVPESAGKVIYITRTSDISKANIVKL